MKPILFNTEMVRALLAGRKSVTRRVAFPGEDLHEFPRKEYLDGWWFRGRAYRKWDDAMREPQGVMSLCKYRPGEILYVKETFRIDYLSNIPGTGRIQYKADDTYADFSFSPARYEMMRRAQLKPGWRPNENMPREAARLFLRVTDVRVERLQDITDDDLVRDFGFCLDAVKAVGRAALAAPFWDSIIKKTARALYGWDANPWVWVIEFEQIGREEAQGCTRGI